MRWQCALWTRTRLDPPRTEALAEPRCGINIQGLQSQGAGRLVSTPAALPGLTRLGAHRRLGLGVAPQADGRVGGQALQQAGDERDARQQPRQVPRAAVLRRHRAGLRAARASASAPAPAPALGRPHGLPRGSRRPRPAPLWPARLPPHTSAGTVTSSTWCRPSWRTAQPKLQRQGLDAWATVRGLRSLHHEIRRLQQRPGCSGCPGSARLPFQPRCPRRGSSAWCAYLDVGLYYVVQSRQRPLHLDERRALHPRNLGSAGSGSLGFEPAGKTRRQEPARHVQEVQTFASISLLAK
jgi:hypothetical protein